jgi:hypothetical protein
MLPQTSTSGPITGLETTKRRFPSDGHLLPPASSGAPAVSVHGQGNSQHLQRPSMRPPVFASDLPHKTPGPRSQVLVSRGGLVNAGALTPPTSHPHRLAYAKMWVNALGVADPLPVDMSAPVGERFKNGTLLCAVLEACGETARLGRTYRRPGVRATCRHNNDAALAVLRLAGVPLRRLPTADELCDGNERRARGILVDLFEVYALRPARANASAALFWMSGILDAYALRTDCLARVTLGKALSGAPEGLWMLIRDGAVLALLAHYYGGDASSGGVDLGQVTLFPSTAAQRLANLGLAAPVLARLGARFVVNDDALATAREDTADPSLLDADDDVALLQV